MSATCVELVKDLRRSTVVVHILPEMPEKSSVEDFMKLAKTGKPLNKGTAFAVKSDKFVTCYHVIKDLDPKKVKLTGAPDYTTHLPMNIQNVLEIESDPELDIALLKAERVQGDIVPIALEAGVPQVGLDILAVGYPLPQQKEPKIIEDEKRVNVDVVVTFRALRGIIASRLADGLHFEIDKLSNPGQSGGPIVSIENGKLVGMCQGFLHYPFQAGVMPADLSICLNADAIRKKLNDWGVTFE